MGSDDVSGTVAGVGNTTLPMCCDDDDDNAEGLGIYEVSITKDDSLDNNATLTAQIVAPSDGTVIKEASTQAPRGFILILGDC